MFQANNYADFLAQLNALNDKDLLSYSIIEGLLGQLEQCSKCRNNQKLSKNTHYKEGYTARCGKCKYFKSLFKGTFFEGRRLPLRKMLEFFFFSGAEV